MGWNWCRDGGWDGGGRKRGEMSRIPRGKVGGSLLDAVARIRCRYWGGIDIQVYDVGLRPPRLQRRQLCGVREHSVGLNSLHGNPEL